nr:putative B3 domain-containing protein At1g78640 [Ipomoea batatas]
MESVSSNSTTTTLEDHQPLPNHDQEEIRKLTLFTGSEEDLPTAAPTIEDHLPIKKRKRRSIIIAPKKPQNNSIQVHHPNTLSAPTIKDHHLPINNHRKDLGNFAELIGAVSSFSLSLFPPTQKINIGPKKQIKNHHRWDDELIHAASSLSLSLPTKRKRLPKPKKPENSSIQEKEEEGVIIAKRQKKVVAAQRGNHKIRVASHGYGEPYNCENRGGLRVKIWDLDTESEHQLNLKQWKTGSFVLNSNWNTEFVKINHGQKVLPTAPSVASLPKKKERALSREVKWKSGLKWISKQLSPKVKEATEEAVIVATLVIVRIRNLP